MPGFLIHAGRVVRVGSRLAVDSPACRRVCCGSGGPSGDRFIRARWCCDPQISWWFLIAEDRHDRDSPCGTSPEGEPYRHFRVPTSQSVVITIPSGLPDSGTLCFATDPGDVRHIEDIPAGDPAFDLCDVPPLRPEIAGSCSDARCGSCPDCCRAVPYPASGGECVREGPPKDACCDCPSSYRITYTEKTEVESQSALGYYLNLRSTQFPLEYCMITPEKRPAWRRELRRTRVWEMRCPERGPGSPDGRSHDVVCISDTGFVTDQRPVDFRYRPPEIGDCDTDDPILTWSFSTTTTTFPVAEPCDGHPGTNCAPDYYDLGGLFAHTFDLFGSLGEFPLMVDEDGQSPLTRCYGTISGTTEHRDDPRGPKRVDASWNGGITCAAGAGTASGFVVNARISNLYVDVQAITVDSGIPVGLRTATDVVIRREVEWRTDVLEPCSDSPCAEEHANTQSLYGSSADRGRRRREFFRVIPRSVHVLPATPLDLIRSLAP